MIKLIRNLIVVACVFFLGYFFGVKEVRFFEISSSSMEPTLSVGDRIATIKSGDIKRHDIVMIDSPEGRPERLVKRVIGLPYETVEVKGKQVFINGRKLDEPYIKEPPEYELEIRIGPDSYFLLGDNRNKSEDGSRWGPVDGDLIRSRVFFRYFPFRDFRMFTKYSVAVIERR